VATIPKQLETKLANPVTLEQTVKTSENAKTIVASTMVASSVTGLSAASMWGAFNTMQLITMQGYTNMELPSNAAAIFGTLDEFFRGGPLNPKKLFQKALVDEKSTKEQVVKRRLSILSSEEV